MYTTHDWTVSTTCGEAFNGDDHARMAALIYRRFGRNLEVTQLAWQRLLQNNTSTEQIRELVKNGLALERLDRLENNSAAYADSYAQFRKILEITEV